MVSMNARVNKEAADRFIFNHLGISKEAMAQQNLQKQFNESNKENHNNIRSQKSDEVCSAQDLEKAEQIKNLFQSIADWAIKKNQKYEFQDTTPEISGNHRKLLYFDLDLYGDGEASTQRQAKIICAKQALENLNAGRILPKPCSKDGLIAFIRQNKDLKSIMITDPDQLFAQQQLLAEQQKQYELEHQEELKKQELENEKKRKEEREQKLLDKEKKRLAKLQEKRASAVLKYTVSLEEQGMLEAYVMLRSHEIQLSVEDQYDFVKFMFKLSEIKEPLEQLGIMNMIPVGSAVTKTVRKEFYTIDVILNYNKASAFKNGGKNLPPETQERLFLELVEQLSLLLSKEFIQNCQFIGSGGLYNQSVNANPVYQVFSEAKGDGVNDPLVAIVKLMNTQDQSKLNASFYLQEITQHDTFYSIKHWHMMQKTLKDDVKFGAVLRVLKQWRDYQQLQSMLYPEVLDSIVVKVFEEISQKDFFQSVLLEESKQETVIFNYFASKMSTEHQEQVSKAAKSSLKWIKNKEFAKVF
ncbi:UNKNOWN [Stylonychia lemnae]|uniref:Uncharacterized protein n=1 Tax=Stylonychia lemnae TaxID=5949 RepID=A0A078AGD9_STYLE|nr:UNKNOWN [Stylonychia lemnae]|eukprot:CDW81365.1 UNKNOWN [Stylonychia lemnae]